MEKQSHNGTENGMKGKKLFRQNKAEYRRAERGNRTNKEQLEALDRRGVAATRERTRLSK